MNKKWYVTVEQTNQIAEVAPTLGLPEYDEITWNGRYYIVANNGNLVARIYLERGRGRPRFDPAAPTVRTTIRLTPAQVAKAEALGNGNVAQGVRNALEQAYQLSQG